ncbi:MarR family winged helix-turn-helix transcriptional regulator [Amycolatopsis sp. cmx-8-4]|uniref:MarR family winged helix-turn-helix transcriptional regulator n=1 Tax=Amycolatopsis sp. cmx-8-4 TaxID=2790947 RepID=UPI00397A2A8A
MTDDRWLDREQSRAWLAFVRLQLRLTYEINRQLQADSDLSLADYDVLTALGNAPDARMPITALAALLGWERSRLSHQAKRMGNRGLVDSGASPGDRRVTEVFLTSRGRDALAAAAPGHVDLVKRLFFGGLPEHLLAPLTEALEQVYENVLDHGTLPDPRTLGE